jgi:hypothetical protein
VGLIERSRAQLRRLRHVWTWRLRYWWLDTESGRQAHIACAGSAALVVVLDLIKMGVAALQPRPAGEPAKAIIWWVVYIIVALIAAAMYVAMKPKMEKPKQDEPTGPTTEDGQAVVRYWGTHWIPDTFELAWKVVGRDPIKSKGGK